MLNTCIHALAKRPAQVGVVEPEFHITANYTS